MIAPERKSHSGLFQGNASFGRIGSPTLTFLAFKRWISSAWMGIAVCAKRGLGVNLRTKANNAKISMRLMHDMWAYCLTMVKKPGWMSLLEHQANPLILQLMKAERSILMLTDDERRILSRWAVKTAFLITTSEP